MLPQTRDTSMRTRTTNTGCSRSVSAKCPALSDTGVLPSRGECLVFSGVGSLVVTLMGSPSHFKPGFKLPFLSELFHFHFTGLNWVVAGASVTFTSLLGTAVLGGGISLFTFSLIQLLPSLSVPHEPKAPLAA